MQPDPRDAIVVDLAGVSQEQIDAFMAGAKWDHDTNPDEWHTADHVAWRTGRGLVPCPFCNYGSEEDTGAA